MAEGKKVKLTIGADTSQMVSSLRQAHAVNSMFGDGLAKTNKGLASLLTSTKQLSSALGTGGGGSGLGGMVGNGMGGALGGNLMTTVKGFGDLTKEVEKSSGIMNRFMSGWTGQLVSVGLKIGGITTALSLAGNYLASAFDRSKTDPALEGLDRLRRATEGWTTSWGRAIDEILNKIATATVNHFGNQNDTHSSNYGVRQRANAKDQAKADFARMGFRFSGAMTPEQRQIYMLLERQRLRDMRQRDWDQFYGADTEIAQIEKRPFTQMANEGMAAFADPWDWNLPDGQSSRRREASAPISIMRSHGMGRLSPVNLGIANERSFGGFGNALSSASYGGGSGPFDIERGGQFAGIFDSMTKKMNEVSEASTAMFGTLSSGLSAGIDALISGQENAGKAALKATAMTLRGMAVEYGVRALAAVFIPGMQGSAAGLAAAAAAAGAGSALLSSLAGGGGGGGGSSVPSSASYAMTRMGPSVPTNVTYNLTGTSHYGSPAKAYEIIQRGETAAAAAGTGSMRSYQLESFD
jgi:hypothetical protein